MQKLQISVVYLSVIVLGRVAHGTVQMTVKAGVPVSLECPREKYTEYHEGLGSLIPPGDYTNSVWILQDCFQKATSAVRYNAFNNEEYKGALRGRAHLSLNGTLNIYRVDQKDAGVYRCYKWINHFGKDRTSKIWGHLELIVEFNGTEIRNPQGECLSEGYRYHTDCPSTNHNELTGNNHSEALYAALITLGLVGGLQTCVIVWLLLRAPNKSKRYFVRNVAYKKLSSNGRKSKAGGDLPENGDSDYEEIGDHLVHISKEQLQQMLGLPNNSI